MENKKKLTKVNNYNKFALIEKCENCVFFFVLILHVRIKNVIKNDMEVQKQKIWKHDFWGLGFHRSK